MTMLLSEYYHYKLNIFEDFRHAIAWLGYKVSVSRDNRITDTDAVCHAVKAGGAAAL